MKFEYKIVRASLEGLVDTLNGFGLEGWEVVALSEDHVAYTVLMKRPVIK